MMEGGGSDNISVGSGGRGSGVGGGSIEQFIIPTQLDRSGRSRRKGGKKGRRWGKKRTQTTDADNAYTAWGSLKRKSKLDLSDDDLFLYFFNRLAGETECKNTDCDCLLILEDELARKAVARYLVSFERKTKYEQDSTVLEWYRYTTSAERGGNTRGPKKGRTNYYHLPYDGNFIDDDNSLQALRNHRLCTEGMKSVMAIGYDRMKSIQTAAKTIGVMPRHASFGGKGHSTKNDSQVLDSLNGHFNYLLQLGEVRAT